MKRIKLNLDKETIRQFLVEHVEKLALAAVGVCFVLIVYEALGRERFDNTPDSLERAATLAEGHWTGTEPPEFANEIPDYVKMVDLGDVDEVPYEHQFPIDPLLFPPPRLRTRPPAFPAEKLRGFAGVGAFLMKRPAQAAPDAPASPEGGQQTPQSGNLIRGRRWVVLTGRVPIKKQNEAFAECFKGVQNPSPQTDVSQHAFYQVERVEVADRGGTGAVQRTLFDSWIEMRIVEQWAKFPAEVVDREYTHEILTYPLPPLVDANRKGRSREHIDLPWPAEEVGYPDEIPSAVKANAPSADGPKHLGPALGPDAEKTTRPKGDPGSALPKKTTEKAEHLLFRYFDFHVEPGKSYRYRVRLWLTNPNRDVADRFLDEQELARKQAAEDAATQKQAEGDEAGAIRVLAEQWRYLLTEWSEATGVITLPGDTRLLAVSVTPPSPSRPDADPRGELMVVKWLEENGRTAYEVFGVDRGQVVNFPGCTFPPAQSAKRGTGNPLPPVRVKPTDSMSIDYLTDAVVLDLRGGGRQPGEGSPGEILVLDAQGDLVVHNELDDRPVYERYTKVPEKAGGGGAPGDESVSPGEVPPFNLHDPG